MKRSLRIEIDRPAVGPVTVKVIDVETDIWARATHEREGEANRLAIELLGQALSRERPCKNCGKPVERLRRQLCPECVANYQRDYGQIRRERLRAARPPAEVSP